MLALGEFSEREATISHVKPMAISMELSVDHFRRMRI
jgi:hypothetical protein